MGFDRALPYALLGLMGLVELPAVGRRRPESTRRDAGSFVLLNLLIGAAFFGSFWLANSGEVGAMGVFAASVARAVAVGLALGGAALRTWAIAVLGRYFTRTVQVSADQPVVTAGPYRLIRHPSYTGLGLEFLAVGLALGNWIAFGAVAAGAIISGIYRIRVEEAALVAAIGEPYVEYMRRTKRLFPFIL